MPRILDPASSQAVAHMTLRAQTLRLAARQFLAFNREALTAELAAPAHRPEEGARPRRRPPRQDCRYLSHIRDEGGNLAPPNERRSTASATGVCRSCHRYQSASLQPDAVGGRRAGARMCYTM